MLSELRKKKLAWIFKSFYDADESGFVEKKDFEEGLNRLAKHQGWKDTDPIYAKVKEVAADIWEGLRKMSDVDNDGKVTLEEWMTMWDFQGTELPEWNKLYAKIIFQVQDATGDGVIDQDEYVQVHSAFGVPKDVAAESFKKLSQGKSTLNLQEFEKLFTEFFLSDDLNAPGNYIFASTKFV
ncbi:calexcitin-2-like [Zerene cesonia]|uniref:calexcitin-2-like n=1 Tax=Zerene cesonia TaxID=33412 RepID=UPI0018E59A5B|nr:calexcitin-2-like [Zerene cesonia]